MNEIITKKEDAQRGKANGQIGSSGRQLASSLQACLIRLFVRLLDLVREQGLARDTTHQHHHHHFDLAPPDWNPSSPARRNAA